MALLLPSLLVPAERQPSFLPGIQILIVGLLLGAGRQGWDVLVLRLLAVGPMVVIGWLVGSIFQHSASFCSVSEGVSCVSIWILAIPVVGSVLAGFFAIIAFPTTILWTRGTASLKAELPWPRLPRPRWSWQWIVLFVAAVITLGVLYFSFRIPAY